MHPSCYLDEPHFVHASFDVTEFEEMWHTHTHCYLARLAVGDKRSWMRMIRLSPSYLILSISLSLSLL